MLLFDTIALLHLLYIQRFVPERPKYLKEPKRQLLQSLYQYPSRRNSLLSNSKALSVLTVSQLRRKLYHKENRYIARILSSSCTRKVASGMYSQILRYFTYRIGWRGSPIDQMMFGC